jgi:hypothetical protein
MFGNDVPIPAKMKSLRRDPRGYPIPWNVLVDSTGKAHFAINVEELRFRAIRERLCPICGARLYRGMWFVGGPMSALHPRGAYIDPPMHHECAEYALRVCPYLALRKYTGLVDDRTLSAPERAKIPLMLDRTVLEDRPALFVAGMALKMRMTEAVLLIPKRPFHQLEFWQHGKQLAPDVGMALAKSEIERQREAVEKMPNHGMTKLRLVR